MSNGTTVEAAINSKAASNHSHSNYAASTHTHTAAQVGALATNGTAAAATKLATARSIRTNLASTAAANFNGTANITPGVTGVLPVANGGTGVNSIANLKTALGISSPAVAPPAKPPSIPAANNTVTWATKTWKVFYNANGIAILGLDQIEETCVFGKSIITYPISLTSYVGTTLWVKCLEFQNKLNLTGCDYLIPVFGTLAWIPTYAMLTELGTLIRESSSTLALPDILAASRDYWTSSVGLYYGSGDCHTAIIAYTLSHGGSPYYYSTARESFLGFRPFVMIKL